MTKYKLEIIPGTLEYVLQELNFKFSTINVLEENENSITFESEADDVDTFVGLMTPLRIKKENGLIRNLFRREWRVATVPAGINPALGYIMCQIAQIQPTETVLDPFCGGGTIALSALLYFQPKKVLASDVSGSAIDTTLRNVNEIKKLGLKKIGKHNFTAFRSNVSQLKLQPNSVNKVITNLPFGIRTKNHDENIKIYEALASKMQHIVTKDGVLVIITQEKTLLLESFAEKSFKLLNSFDVKQGGLIPRIFVYKKV